MSIHSSLKISRGIGGQRNVWTRMERILALKKQGRWQDGDKVLALPKVRTHFKSKTKKAVKAEAAEIAALPVAPPPVEGKKPSEGKKSGEGKKKGEGKRK